jgi:hypothetical protein
MTKKPKTVWVGNTPVMPCSRINNSTVLTGAIKKRHERLRRRYKEVRGEARRLD